MYADRAEAGRVLAGVLGRFAKDSPVVVALPRGGVVVGHEVSRALRAPLEILVVRKIGAPTQPELAIGAVAEAPCSSAAGPEILLNHHAQSDRVPPGYIEAESARQVEEVRRRQASYRAGRTPISVHGRSVILVDDGIATGASARAALRALWRAGAARLILAVPVGPVRVLEALLEDADEVVCPLVPDDFGAVGEFYRTFDQTTDAEVIDLLNRSRGEGHEENHAGPAAGLILKGSP